MLAPRLFVATSPSTPIAAAVSRVVVVLPLVPEISAICRPAARLASRFGSSISPILPPITEPSPRPAARDRAAALRDRELAILARSGSFLSVISLPGMPMMGSVAQTLPPTSAHTPPPSQAAVLDQLGVPAPTFLHRRGCEAVGHPVRTRLRGGGPLSESRRGSAEGYPLHPAPQRMTCASPSIFARTAAGFTLTVEGRVVRIGEPGRLCRPPGGARVHAGRRWGRCFSAPTLLAWTTRAG